MIPCMHPAHTPEVRSEPVPLLRPFMPELDTLRGIAVLGVMCLHAFFWQYASFSFGRWGRLILNITRPGWVGVNLFFVLSGFLITGILLDSRTRPDYYRRFYTRRALRILPAYYLLLLCLLVLRSSSPAFVGLSFIYLSNVTNFFGVSCDYGPLWSLAAEEHSTSSGQQWFIKSLHGSSLGFPAASRWVSRWREPSHSHSDGKMAWIGTPGLPPMV